MYCLIIIDVSNGVVQAQALYIIRAWLKRKAPENNARLIVTLVSVLIALTVCANI